MKRFFPTLLVLFIAFSSFAQNVETSSQKIRSSELAIGTFCDNWFISLGAGGRYFMGTDNSSSFSKQLSPAIDVSFGKWLTPLFAGRIQYIGYNVHSNVGANNWLVKDGLPLNSIQNFYFNSMNFNVMFNLIGAIAGYNPNRVYELIPFAGAGYGMTNTKERDFGGFFFMGGLLNKFRVCGLLDINLELRGMAISGTVFGDEHKGTYNSPFDVTAGVTFYLQGQKGREFRPVQNQVDYKRLKQLQNQVESLNNETNALKSENAELTRRLAEKPMPISSEPAAKATQEVLISSPIYFEINSDELSEKEKAAIKYLADYIKANRQQKYAIEGYADCQTGSAEYNEALSQRRAEHVKDVLVRRYRVPASLLTAKGMGCNDYNASMAEYNRVVIISVEK